MPAHATTLARGCVAPPSAIAECPQSGLTSAGLPHETECTAVRCSFTWESKQIAPISWNWPTMRSYGSNFSDASIATTAALAEAARLLWNIPAGRRPGILVRALACSPEITLEASFASGPLRAAMSSAWEAVAGTALPIEFLRRLLERRDDAAIVDVICGAAFANTSRELEVLLTVLITQLVELHAHEASVASSTTD